MFKLISRQLNIFELKPLQGLAYFVNLSLTTEFVYQNVNGPDGADL